jgi:hypothetical protein
VHRGAEEQFLLKTDMQLQFAPAGAQIATDRSPTLNCVGKGDAPISAMPCPFRLFLLFMAAKPPFIKSRSDFIAER